MKKILLATVAVFALAAPSFSAEPEKTVGQAPQSFYLAQDTATMKCQIVETQPAEIRKANPQPLACFSARDGTKPTAGCSLFEVITLRGDFRWN